MSAAPSPWNRALVAFSDRADLPWLRLLRRGFRHCFVALGSDGGWITVNAMAHRTEIAVLPVAAGFDLAGWYRGQGLIVVETRPRIPPRRALPWRPFTCVELSKRVLGLTDGTILTPWHLYQKISHIEENILDARASTRLASCHQHHSRA